MYTNVYSSFTYNNLKLERKQCPSMSEELNDPARRTLFSNMTERTIDTRTNLDESPENCVAHIIVFV